MGSKHQSNFAAQAGKDASPYRKAATAARRRDPTGARPSLSDDWQIERAAILHRACQGIRAAVSSGKGIQRKICQVSRRLNGRPFKCDPSRRLFLSATTMRRVWDAWRRGGEVPAARRLQYRVRRPRISAALLIRFANFCSGVPLPSVKDAWQRFAARGGNFGRGRHAGNRLKITYGQICYHFPASVFYRMQYHLKTIRAEQSALGQLRMNTIADIRNRVPDRPPRVKRGNTFDI